MAEKKVVLTYEGLKNMEAELENLKTVRRKDVAEKIKEARGQGDPSENAEYDAAKEALTNIAMQIAAMNPQYISRSEISDEELAKIREIRAISVQKNTSYACNLIDHGSHGLHEYASLRSRWPSGTRTLG